MFNTNLSACADERVVDIGKKAKTRGNRRVFVWHGQTELENAVLVEALMYKNDAAPHLVGNAKRGKVLLKWIKNKRSLMKAGNIM